MMEEATKPHETSHAASKKKGFFKNKSVLIGVVVALVVLLGAGGYFFIANQNQPEQEEESVGSSDIVESLSAEELGLSMEAKPNKQAVKIKITKASDIKTIEYQVTYEADSTAQERAEGGEDRVQRGITGEAAVSGSTYESEWLDLGSCSRNVCKYDKGVTTVDLTLKIVKKSGKTYESQSSLEL